MASIFRNSGWSPALRLLPLLAWGFGPALAAPGDSEATFPQDPTAWPAVSSVNQPWTRWWWLGSGVDQTNLTRELEGFAKAGIGGVEICPIYGAVGAEDRFIDFLSPKWLAMLAHTTTEAKRLGLGVDLTTGTGWPFGGPMVTPDMASSGIRRIRAHAVGGKPLVLKLPDGETQCLRAYPAKGAPIDLTTLVRAGKLEWTPPPGDWTLLGFTAKTRLQKVKRAAPGGAGEVLDPFAPQAMTRYLAAFDRAFAGFSAPRPRAEFHDSFEYYGADWTPGFFSAFQAARGYDLRDQLPAFSGSGDAATVARVRADYRETLGELHRDYLKTWHDWARQHGSVTRNQAHGSPGNLLDHYAVSEIPETEIFRQVADDQIPMLRFAASAAHANGSTLVSSESFTWLGEHFQVTPGSLKEAADFVFLGGVNHLFFHGIPYSPQDAPWPGWLFYASTHLGPNGGLWRDLPTFTGYLQRCQSILQCGTPSSEVLLYFPYHDLLHDGAEKLPLFTIHNQGEWLHPTRFHRTAMELWQHGITFDYASDAMLAGATVREGRIMLGNNAFKVLVLPGAKHLATTTLENLLRLADQGGRIIVQGDWPDEVPGFHQHEARRSALRALESRAKGGFGEVPDGILPALESCGLLREPMAASGLRFIRRSHDRGYHYFIVNRGREPVHAIIPLAASFESAILLDPWRPAVPGMVIRRGAEPWPNEGSPPNAIPVSLVPGESMIVRTFTRDRVEGPSWRPDAAAPVVRLPIEGPWRIEFIEGGPALPNPATMATLASWTTLPDPAVRAFSGTARYTTTLGFDRPNTSRVRLELGRVAHTARVYLNGKPAGVSWCQPHRVDLSGLLKPGPNQLVIEVTNLAANRIADLDRRKVPWKRFHEINFVNIDYQPFDASDWPPSASGLLGPLQLVVEDSGGREVR